MQPSFEIDFCPLIGAFPLGPGYTNKRAMLSADSSAANIPASRQQKTESIATVCGKLKARTVSSDEIQPFAPKASVFRRRRMAACVRQRFQHFRQTAECRRVMCLNLWPSKRRSHALTLLGRCCCLCCQRAEPLQRAP